RWLLLGLLGRSLVRLPPGDRLARLRAGGQRGRAGRGPPGALPVRPPRARPARVRRLLGALSLLGRVPPGGQPPDRLVLRLHPRLARVLPRRVLRDGGAT